MMSARVVALRASALKSLSMRLLGLVLLDEEASILAREAELKESLLALSDRRKIRRVGPGLLPDDRQAQDRLAARDVVLAAAAGGETKADLSGVIMRASLAEAGAQLAERNAAGRARARLEALLQSMGSEQRHQRRALRRLDDHYWVCRNRLLLEISDNGVLVRSLAKLESALERALLALVPTDGGGGLLE